MVSLLVDSFMPNPDNCDTDDFTTCLLEGEEGIDLAAG